MSLVDPRDDSLLNGWPILYFFAFFLYALLRPLFIDHGTGIFACRGTEAAEYEFYTQPRYWEASAIFLIPTI